MGVRFVGVRKDRRGNITQLLTSSGQVVSVHEARIMALSGELDSLADLHAEGSWEVAQVSGANSSAEGRNLDQLPDF